MQLLLAATGVRAEPDTMVRDSQEDQTPSANTRGSSFAMKGNTIVFGCLMS
jgi:hypothetical protein